MTKFEGMHTLDPRSPGIFATTLLLRQRNGIRT